MNLRQRLFVSSLTDGETGVKKEDLEKINNLKSNGPLRPLTAAEVFVRKMIILGEEPTTKLSVHPEKKTIAGLEVNSLSDLAATLPGSPMLEGHRTDKCAWGRIFEAEVLDKMDGYSGHVLKIGYYFLAADNGAQKAARIDGGIDAEGSIQYKFKKAKCAICGQQLMIGSFLGMTFTKMKCMHILGEQYDGITCYWYPEGLQSMEVSSVFRGAYTKTRSVLSMENIPKTEEELCAVYQDEEGKEEKIEMALTDAIIAEMRLPERNEDGTTGTETAGTEGKAETENTAGDHTEPGNNPPAVGGTQSGDIAPTLEGVTKEGVPVLSGPDPAENKDEEKIKCFKCGKEIKPEKKDEGYQCPECKTPIDEKGKEPPKKTVKCEACSKDFEYVSIPEEKPGCVKCPGCGELVDQNGKKVQKKEVGKYLVCANPECGYWEDNKNNEETTNKTCPKCCGNLIVKNEKPQEKKEPEKNSFLVCYACGYSIEEKTAQELGIKDCFECEVALVQSESQICDSTLKERLKIGEIIGPIKPLKSGVQNNEFFEIEAFAKLEGKFHVEPKYDGVYFELHKCDSIGSQKCDTDKKVANVRLMTDSGTIQNEKFPNIIAEAEKMEANNFVLVGEIVKYRGRQRGTHTDVTSYINGKGPYEDYHFRFKPFDMAYANGLDIRGESLSTRREKMDVLIHSTAHIHPTKYNVVSGGPKLVRAIEAMATREGAMIKNAEMTLNAEGRDKIYKWKRHTEIDAQVDAVKEKSGGGYVYGCSVGTGEEKKHIGETYTTKVKAKVGDILQVTVDKVTYDETAGTYSWYAPKVIALREDKHEPDPLSTVKKIAEIKNPKSRAKNGIVLTDIISVLEKAEFGFSLYVCGGLVAKGSTEHDIDLLTERELSAEEKAQVLDVLGEDHAPYVDFIVNAGGPDGTHVKFAAKNGSASAAEKYAKKFVLHRHSWGKAEHYDLRFGNPDGTKMWGFTCFKEPTKDAGGPKVRCEEKQYHDVKWLDFEGKIKPGDPGNPTKNHVAEMVILDKGKYDFVKRTSNFLEVVLHGKKWLGRYVFRKIEVKSANNELAVGDEAGSKGTIWVMWKPKDQTVGTPVKKLEYAFREGVLYYWEGSDFDKEC